jgi:hypothetical protein
VAGAGGDRVILRLAAMALARAASFAASSAAMPVKAARPGGNSFKVAFCSPSPSSLSIQSSESLPTEKIGMVRLTFQTRIESCMRNNNFVRFTVLHNGGRGTHSGLYLRGLASSMDVRRMSSKTEMAPTVTAARRFSSQQVAATL